MAILQDAADRSGKYLTFKLSDEEYGLEILKVREIMGLLPITPIPRAPDFIRGVINLRGKVIPVVSLRRKFGISETQDTEQTCIIVVDVARQNDTHQMGIVVDSVSEVLTIKGEDIEPAPAFGDNVETEFILGLAKAKGSVKILLNIQRILTTQEVVSLQAAAAGKGTSS